MRLRTEPLHRERAHDDPRPPAPRRRSPAGGLLPVVALAAAAVAVGAATPASAHTAPAATRPAAATCIASGTEAAINAALAGAGAEAVLCPGAVFQLSNSITFTAPNQKVYTQGLPTDATRANLVVIGAGLSTAIQGNGQPGVAVQSIQINGNRPALGVVSGGGALLEMGGAGTNQTVQNVYAHDTRSWSTLHFIEGRVTNNTPECQGGQILNNQIGPAGTATPDATGVWADGISLACGGSLVQGNTITDATDGAIVVFGAPGSTVQNNTIIAKNQLLLGGINMVDYAPMNGNYTGTVVTHNTIDALSAFIKMGIAQGQQAWNCLTGTNYGATVTGNTLEGQYMGYGYAVDGVSDWTVTGNVDNSRHVGTQTAGGCFGSPRASQPAGYQVESATSSNLQPEFTSGVLTNALGTLNSPPITAPSGPTLTASPSNVSFGNQAVGTTSAAHALTISNTGGSAATISSIAASAPFAQTNTCGATLAASASCTVNVTFSPATAGAASGSVTIASNATNSPTTIALSGTGTSATTNLALAAVMTAATTAPGYPATNANDGNSGSYWESLNGAGFPQTLTANLGSTQNLGSVTLRLPPSTAWATRTETLSVLASTNGTTYTTVLPPAGYTFNPAAGNTVSVSLPAGTAAQYLRLSVTANTGWPAAQLAEFEIYAGAGNGGATLTATPTSLSFGSQAIGSTSAAQSVTVRNTGTSAATLSSVSAPAPFTQTNGCGTTLAAGASCTVSVTFRPTAGGAASASLTVLSNATNPALTVALSGTGTGGTTPTNLALNAPIAASSYTQTYVAGNADDGDTGTYWEGANGAWPATLTVDLGSAKALASVVLHVPPATAWSTRTQTLAVLGSTNNSTWSTLVGSATYTFDPATGNAVTIILPAGTTDRYLRLSFTANSVQNAAQTSEFQ
ncbi:MAG TPA: choice-of-anchor D domain-containing protein, partial [Rugosimonospora sp.]